MDSKPVKLDEFIGEYRFWGEWEVSYTDGTHLPEDEYVKLGEIIIDACERTAQDYPILPFVFRPVSGQCIKSSVSLNSAKERIKRIEQKNLYKMNLLIVWSEQGCYAQRFAYWKIKLLK